MKALTVISLALVGALFFGASALHSSLPSAKVAAEKNAAKIELALKAAE